MTLKTRKPTGLAPWPVVLIEGAEKTGKSYMPAVLTADPRIGDTYWIDFGEGAADQYAALPGACYMVVDHDGTVSDLKAQVAELVKLPGHDAQGRPNVAVLDSATNLWTAIKNIAQAEANRRRGKDDAQITMDLWNKARAQWKAIIDPLIQWDGLVLITARGKEVTALDDQGKPMMERGNAVKTYTLETHKTLPYDVDVVLRPLSPGTAMLTGARSAFDLTGELEQPRSKYTLSYLLFDVLRLGQAPAGTRDLKVAAPETAADEVPVNEAKLAVYNAVGKDAAAAKKAWADAGLSDDGAVAKAALTKLVESLTVAAAPAPVEDPGLGDWDPTSTGEAA